MLTYHNDPRIKSEYQARYEAHRAADEVVQRVGYEDGRGCFIGCTLDSYDPERFPDELGWPTWFAHLADAVFEGLDLRDGQQFGSDLHAAMPVGVDLDRIKIPFLICLQRRNLLRVTGDDSYAVQCREAIQNVVGELDAGVKQGPAEWDAAWAAAWFAAGCGAAAKTAQFAARSAWKSVQAEFEWSVVSAAECAADSAGADSDWSILAVESELKAQRDDILRLIKELSC